jgi:stage II sporulation protein D
VRGARRVEQIVSVGVARAGGYDVVKVPIEDYVARVVVAEAAAASKPAALEAIAILARTYAMANLGRHRADGFDLCDLTHCQVMGTATADTRRAAQATEGQVLLYHGAPASVFYTASCGGRSALASEVWGGGDDMPFLIDREDAHCRDLPAWTTEITAENLLGALRANGFRGDELRGVTVISRSASGRVARLGLTGLTPSEIGGDDLRLALGRTIGWQFVKSTAFELTRTASGYRFTGRGSGHGVGLCEVGAARMAEKGQSAASILLDFFPGTELGAYTARPVSQGPQSARPLQPAIASRPATRTRVLATPIAIVLPATDEPQRGAVTDLAARLLADLTARLGVQPASPVRLIFHPTVESYQRATGQSWWTAAATRGDTIHLLPLTILRQRQTLDTTLRHELVHQLTNAALKDRHAWVREGAAIFYSGEYERQKPPPAGRPCPTDDEIWRPRSGATLEEAYRRAGACFARAIAAGTRWRDVR